LISHPVSIMITKRVWNDECGDVTLVHEI